MPSDVFDRARVPVPMTAARRIQSIIRDGAYRVGDRLPSQRRLAEELNVSRASLREALSVLETLDVVKVEVGRGVFVSDKGPSEDKPAAGWRFGDEVDLRHVYDMRICLEGHVAQRAAAHASDALVARLARCIADFEAACTNRDLVSVAALDERFHDLLLEASGNPLLPQLKRSIGGMFTESQRLPMQDHDSIQKTLCEHRTILDAVQAGDGRRARQAMHAHIRAAAERAGIDLASACH